MALINQRVIEDGLWLVLLMAIIAFFWFHQWGKRRAGWSHENEQVMQSQENSKPVRATGKAA